MTLLKSIYHILEGSNSNTCYLTQLIHILSEVWLLDVHRLVRTPSWNHLDLETTLTSLLVIAKIIDWVVCSTYALYMITTHQATSAVLWQLQLLVTFIENLTSSLWTELLLDTKSSFELQVSPVIKRVTECIRHCLCPFLKLLPVGGISTSAVALIHAIGTHSTPLVMVTAEPKLCDTLKLVIISYHLRDEVTVIINDRHLCRMIVEKILRSLSVEQEIFIHKLFHNRIVVFKCFVC